VSDTASNAVFHKTTSGQPGDQSNRGPGLADLEGNAIVSNPGATPGFFSYSVYKGTQVTMY
jgi:hypothetical protein